MTTGSIPLGKFFGIPLRAHWTIALVALLFGASLSSFLGVGGAAIAMAFFFASIVVHELSHALTARRYGVNTESIDLWALGGVARLDRESPTARADGWIAVAGPLASLALGAAFTGAAIVLQSNVMAWLGFINFLLAVFNMLPGAPLDGGRVLRAWRWGRHGDRYRAMREAGTAGRVLGWSLGIVGVALMLYGRPGIFIALMGAFIAINARAEVLGSYIQEKLDGIKVGDLTWFGVAHAGNDMDADSMIWQRQRLGGAGAVAVDADGDGSLDGVVLEDQLWAVPEERRPMVLLTQLMVPFSQTARAQVDDDLTSVLPRINPLRPIVTVWNGDRLAGIIPPALLKERLTAAQEF